MKEKKRILSAYKRKVHIDEQEWTYVIKRAFYKDLVKVCSPDQTKKWTLEVGMLGHSSLYTDVKYWNALTPSHIKRLIEKRILGREIIR